MTITNTLIDNSTDQLMMSYYVKQLVSDPDCQNIKIATGYWDLESFGLVSPDGKLTNAGLLFVDNCTVFQSRIFCTRWTGLHKDDAISSVEHRANLKAKHILAREGTTRRGYWRVIINKEK